MISVLLLAQASAAVAPVPSVPPARPRASEIANVQCVVLDEDAKRYALEFRLAPRGGQSSFTVARDETGTFGVGDALFDNVTLENFSGEWSDARLARFSPDGQSLAAVRFFPASGSGAAVVLERQAQPMMDAAPVFSFAGTCRKAQDAVEKVKK